MVAKDSTIDYIWTDKKRTLFGLPLSFTRYYLTETRLITRVGFFHVEEEEIELYRITDKKLSLSLGQRIFRVGSIILYSKDVDTPEKELRSIRTPRYVSDLITQCVNAQRDRFHIRGRDMIGDVECNHPDVDLDSDVFHADQS